MTPDFILGQLRLAAVAILAYAGGRGWLTPADAGLLTALGTSLGPILIPWVWSVAVNVGVVHVSASSAAAAVATVEKRDPVAANIGASTAQQAAV
jgi:hypothetical protein